MKRVIATLLRHRSSWQRILISALAVSVALLISYNVYSSTRQALKGVFILPDRFDCPGDMIPDGYLLLRE